MSENAPTNSTISRRLRSPKTIRARLNYDPLPPPPQPVSSNVTIRSNHAFITDKYNPIPLSPRSYTRAILNEATAAASAAPSARSSGIPDTRGDRQITNVKDVADEPLVVVESSQLVTNATAAATTFEEEAHAAAVGNVDQLKTAFVQRKEEREKCSKEFTEFLTSSLATPPAAVQVTTIEPPTINVAAVSRASFEPANDPLQMIAEKIPPTLHHRERSNVVVKSKTATLTLSPRELRPVAQHSRNARFHASKQAKATTQHKSSTTDVPPLKITSSSKASSINLDTSDRQPAATATTDRDGAGTGRQRSVYNAAEARKFMAEQQKKRKLANRSVDVKEKNAAEDRKRRLAELQTHTRKIVQRNVTKNIMKVSNRNTAPDEVVAEPTKRPFIDNKSNVRRGPDRGTIHFAFPPPTETDRTARVLADAAANSNNTAIVGAAAGTDTMRSTEAPSSTGLPASNSNRRAGILRRPDEPQQTHSQRIASPMNIHFDQLLASALAGLPESSTSTLANSPRQTSNQLLDFSKLHAHPLQMPDVSLKTPKTATTVAFERPQNVGSSAKTSPRTAESSSTSTEQTHVKDTRSTQTAKVPNAGAVNVPHWLRPSPMQVYPYNFIMAVRKKLELIANPTLSTAANTQNQIASLTPRARPGNFKKKNTSASDFQQKLQQQQSDATVFAQQEAAEQQRKNAEQTPSESDGLTNLSSMSLQVPPSTSHSKNNDPNQMPSHKHHNSDSDSQATISVSSAIFSQSSPEKKPIGVATTAVEPLSTKAIADLRVVSSATKPSTKLGKSKHIGYPFVNTRRGSEIPDKTQNTRQTSSTSVTQLDKSNIIDMLDSFNRSLSHAISVNQQLHETLNRPTIETFGSKPSPTVPSVSNREEYSSKFDSISSQATLSQPNTGKTVSSQSTSLLENESSIESSVIVTAAPSFRTEGEANTLHSPIVSDSTASKTGATTTASSGQSTLIETNQSVTQTSLASGVDPKSASSIRTQIGTSDEPLSPNLTVTSVARHFEENYAALPSVRSLESKNWPAAVAQSPISTDRFNCMESSAKNSVRSSTTSTTVTMKSLHAGDLVAHDETTKENNVSMSNVENRDNAFRRASDQELNKSIGSDIFAVFNQTDFEYSIHKTHGAHSTSTTTTTLVSDANISYSALGMYDQLLKSEDQKSCDLTALLKARERALMDRTKGQIAWLELQKQKYQERGLTAQITAVKKKQRALLMRLEKERAELARSAKQSTAGSLRPKHSAVLKLSQLKTPTTVARSISPLAQPSSNAAKSAVRAIDFTGDHNLEAMLQHREDALRQRRAHVESLIRWHQRLDAEEKAVADMECQLMARTNLVRNKYPSVRQSDIHDASHQRRSPLHIHQRQIRTIEQSLEILKALPSAVCQPTTVASDVDGTETAGGNTTAASLEMREERVSVSGSKLNRLWRRLTGESACKFIPDRKYELSKADIASVYEEAKQYVIAQFGSAVNRADRPLAVLNQTQLSTTSTMTGGAAHNDAVAKIAGATTTHHSIACDEFIVVPALNLNFTSAEEHSMSASDADAGTEAAQSGYYFTDNAQSLRMDEEEEGNKSAPPEWRDDAAEEILGGGGGGSSHSLDASSARTFQIEPPAAISNTLRENAFSVDSLNSSRPEVSEATSNASGGGAADESNSTPAVVVTTARADEDESTKTTPTIATTASESAAQSAIPEDFNDTPQIADTSCPTLMNDSVSISEQSMLMNSSVHTQLSLPSSSGVLTVYTADKHSATTTSSDNNQAHLHSSYSERFDSTATTPTMITTASDKISEAIEAAAQAMSSKTTTVSEGVPNVDEALESEKTVCDEQSSEAISNKRSSDTTTIAPESSSKTSTKSHPNDSSEDKENQRPDVNGVKEAHVLEKHIGSPSANDEPAVLHVAGAENASTTYKMPDIISEAEVLRRQQMRIEEEIKQLEESATAPFVYIREIPNKPPPPYVPPAHGSPMTAIFPSDSRIQEIVYRRVELLLKTPTNGTDCIDANPIGADTEPITNIYERIALDICAECLKELPPVNAPPQQMHFRHLLAFYNPPDRLQCMQQHVLRRVKKLLRHPQHHTTTPSSPSSGIIANGCASNAVAAIAPPATVTASVQTTATYDEQIAVVQPTTESSSFVSASGTVAPPLPANYAKCLQASNGLNNPAAAAAHQQHQPSESSSSGSNGICSSVGAKRKLWWNEILLNEMMEDDATWTNFDAERAEVLRSVSEEIMRLLVEEALVDCERAFRQKTAAAAAARN